MFELTPIALALFVTTTINIVVSYISWQRRRTKGGLFFSLGMMGVTLWTLAAALDYAAVPLYLKILFAKLEAIGYHSALSLLAVFSMSYAGNDRWLEKRWVRALLLLTPLTNILLTITNELHHWIWTGFIQKENNIVVFEHGPMFNWAAIGSYLLVIVMFLNLWMASRKGSDIARRQARILVLALLFPLETNLLYRLGVGGIEGVDWTSITFSVSGLLFLYALYGIRFLDIVPIARDKVMSGLSDGMILLDMQNRIIDINHVAANLLDSQPASLIGKDLASYASLNLSFWEQPLEDELRTELEVGIENKRYFDVLVSPLRESNKRIMGRLIILRDITRLKENELRLLQLTQAIEQSPASVVITDTKGTIIYVNPEFTTLTGYAHDEVIGKSPSIIQSGQTPREVYQNMWETIRSGQTWRGELLNRKKNGELYWEDEMIAPVLDHEGKVINFVAIKQDITNRKQTEFELEQRFMEIQELHKNLQQTQIQLVEQQRTLAKSEERRRLGRDMHDSVNQSIHSLMLFSDTLISLLEKKKFEKAMHAAQRIHASGEQALKEIRLLVYETQSRPVDENTTLIGALENRLNMVERRVGMKAEIICGADAMPHFPVVWNENLYWMIVEALNNSLKHAHARNVRVVINCTEQQLEVEVKDDGIGFDTNNERSDSFGMGTMRERAEILGGELSVQSSPGHGTSVFFKARIGD